MDWFYLNGLLLLFPILLVRYGILGIITQDGLSRAQYEPKVKIRYINAIYNVSINILFLSLFFYKIKYTGIINHIGIVTIIIGFILYLLSVINFSHPNDLINNNGLYKKSRNPMYVSFFIYFIGVCLILESLITLLFLLIYQFSCHFIIKSEEAWCLETFGIKYQEYMKNVRRYF